MCRRLASRAVVAGCLAIGALERGPAAAATDADIAVVGNQRIAADTVRSYFHRGADGWLDAGALDAALKALYASGLFQDVQIARDDGRIRVRVVENPTIRRLAFEGNKRIKDEQLKNEVQSKQGGPLSRPLVQGDVNRITDLYRHDGRFTIRVEPKIIDLKGDRADLVFEIKEGEKTGVRQVRFVGNKAYTSAALAAVIKTRETSWLSFLLGNDTYDAERIEADRDLLRRFYLGRGYADMRVPSASAQYDPDKKGFVVTFAVDEGSRYRIGAVDIESRLKTVDAASLRSRLRTYAGDVYNAEAVDRTVEDLSSELGKHGEPFISVRPRAERASDRQVIDIIYTIEPGHRVYVERIEIRGNRKTLDHVIRREFDLVEGDAYNRALIERGERRLKNLGYFKTVKITEQPGSAPDRVIVDVTVEEQPTGDFTIAGGYSTDNGPIAELGASERNFLGRGEFVKASITYGEYTRGFDLAFSTPYLFDNRISLGLDLFALETAASSYRSYGSTIYGGKFALGTALTEELGLQWRSSLYNQSVTVDPTKGVASLPIQQAALAVPMWVSAIGTGVIYSTLDNNNKPTNGFRAVVNEDLAGLGGDVKFIKTTEDVRYYHEVTDGVVGMLRAQGGYVTPWGGQQLPLLNGFFGGPQLVRGFAPNGFGPRDVTPGTTMDNIGGNVYWSTTAEMQSPIPLLPSELGLKAAVFADAGSLWSTGSASAVPGLSQSLQIANSPTLRSSIGAGLVWDSMFGPLRVDYAYPISKATYDVTQRLYFTAGRF